MLNHIRTDLLSRRCKIRFWGFSGDSFHTFPESIDDIIVALIKQGVIYR